MRAVAKSVSPHSPIHLLTVLSALSSCWCVHCLYFPLQPLWILCLGPKHHLWLKSFCCCAINWASKSCATICIVSPASIHLIMTMTAISSLDHHTDIVMQWVGAMVLVQPVGIHRFIPPSTHYDWGTVSATAAKIHPIIPILWKFRAQEAWILEYTWCIYRIALTWLCIFLSPTWCSAHLLITNSVCLCDYSHTESV